MFKASALPRCKVCLACRSANDPGIITVPRSISGPVYADQIEIPSPGLVSGVQYGNLIVNLLVWDIPILDSGAPVDHVPIYVDRAPGCERRKAVRAFRKGQGQDLFQRQVRVRRAAARAALDESLLAGPGLAHDCEGTLRPYLAHERGKEHQQSP